MANILPSAELFVTQGILPENIPPIFNTQHLWSHFSDFGNGYGITGKGVGEHATYNASKRGGQRRIFGMPHPAYIRDAGLFYEKHWDELSKLLQGSSGSASKPNFVLHGNRHVRITPHSDLPRIRLRAFSRFKYCLVTDVARFFPSIYTHSIPWAINGKKESKEDQAPQSAKIYGNRLDFILRQSQSKQTIGIAVGPDVSKVASELLMASVDRCFLQMAGRANPIFVRHVDDYWVAGNTYEECEKHLQNLRMALREHELDINEAKTKIVSTKLVFGEDWPFEFDKEILLSLTDKDSDKNESLSILSKVVERATITEDDGIIRHAIRRIDEKKLWSSDWDLLQHFLAQCAVQFPHSFDYVARVIA
ncbi:RNA-directed DNA polymerase [Mesorhizobium sp. CCNWLW179-1]|uniref:RNA-directed DNA polymerase n=1 Tax=unclassified Mesorhizobium TaxID=325217 RepID=UPI003014676F